MDYYYQDPYATIYNCSALELPLADESIDCCITSPPYWGLRDYKTDGQIGLEATPEEYVSKIVQVFQEVRRVLKKEGTLWLNLGDSYVGGKGQSGSRGADYQEIRHEKGDSLNTSYQTLGGQKETRPTDDRKMLKEMNLKPKDLVGIPWRVAFALQADGWWLRQDIIWSKPNPMPESVTDRCTKSHEYIFLLSKSAKYYYDQQAILEPIAESTIGRGPVDFGGAKGRNYKEGVDTADPNYRAGSEQWGRTYDYQKSSRKMNGDNTKIGGNSTGFQGHSGNYDAEGNYLDNPLGRNRRSVWTITTQPYKKAHFATYPPKLVEPCIMAGTSEKGVCPDCGKAWKRILQRGNLISTDGTKDNYRPIKTTDDPKVKGRSDGWTPNHFIETITLGWQPTCKCGKEPIPATVIDPFAGSGTTGEVAKKLRRKVVLIDINAEYCNLSQERISKIILPLPI